MCLGSLQFFLAICYTVAATPPVVHGPGLLPQKIVMPARYFYVDLRTYEPNGYKESMVKDLDVELNGQTAAGGGRCRLWINKLDRMDGTFIVRYKLYETCKDFTITVMYKKKHLGESPYKIHNKLVQADQCNCPKMDIEDWLQQYSCPRNYTQITADLEPFPTLDMKSFIPKVVKRLHRPQSVSFCHYAITDNIIRRKCYGDHIGFNMFSDNILLSLARKLKLPDVEFVMNLGDWPLARSDMEPLPIWSWCGSEDTLDVLLPTYDLTESSLENMGRVMLDMLSVQATGAPAWEDRIPRVFWRGRDSRAERLKLVEIARTHPDLFNASLTNFFFFRDQEKHYGKQPHESFFKFFEYKYQLNIDGTVAAYRMPYLLAGGSLIFKQDSPYREHFYHNLRPYEHYVPVKRDLSDLVERVRWAIDNDSEAKRIAETGRNFAATELDPHHVFCYHAVLLWEWSERMAHPVIPSDDMTVVRQPDADTGRCRCSLSQPHTEL